MKQIAIIGCGSMGGGLALLFAENGLHVSLKDPKVEIIDDTIEKAKSRIGPLSGYARGLILQQADSGTAVV